MAKEAGEEMFSVYTKMDENFSFHENVHFKSYIRNTAVEDLFRFYLDSSNSINTRTHSDDISTHPDHQNLIQFFASR